MDGVEYFLPHFLRDPESWLSGAGVAQDFAGSAVEVDFVECERCLFFRRRLLLAGVVGVLVG